MSRTSDVIMHKSALTHDKTYNVFKIVNSVRRVYPLSLSVCLQSGKGYDDLSTNYNEPEFEMVHTIHEVYKQC